MTSAPDRANARIVVVDDEPNIRRLLEGVLGDEGYDVVSVDSIDGLVAELDRGPADLVLLDVCLPGTDGMQWLRRMADDHRDEVGAVVMMSGHASVELAVDAVRRGAVDFLEKPIHGERLLVSVENALALGDLRRENERLRARTVAPDMIGESAPLAALREAIARAAPTDATVLVTGENGTGKELVARALHASSRRARGPYQQINCAALPASLLESILFGHEKGAFTGADRRHHGVFENAHRGTLLLDEIGEIRLDLQAKLLRVLEDGAVLRLGAATPRRVDVRVIASTNRDLRAEVAAGRFREDLYYRLAVLEITVPSLRERPDDVGVLAEHFAGVFAREFSRAAPPLDDEAVAVLRAHRWPGNVRELRNVMARLVALNDGVTVGADAVRAVLEPGATAMPAAEVGSIPRLQDALESTERDLIRRALLAHDGNKAAAARALGLDRANLHRKMKRLGLEGA